MACATCTSNGSGAPGGCKSNGSCGSGGCNKLEVFDWLAGMKLPGDQKPFDLFEIRFKNSRKTFFRNVNNLELHQGDVVVVESSPGHDVGVVAIAGELVRLQMNKKGLKPESSDYKKIYRKATQEDIDKWKSAKELEKDTMYHSRKIASGLGLAMKISDVEYQGDKSKATFFYTADDRVDFRELIKKLAETFRVRIEMRQIGARQEAGRLGGIASCGRELCCATWLTDFRSVSTSAARYQQLSLNPQKLAGQCGKLKCCLNYELDMYLEAYKEFPDTRIKLKTKNGDAFHFKTDIFKQTMWYILEGGGSTGPVPLQLNRVKEIIAMNERKKYPEGLKDFMEVEVVVEPSYENVVGQDELTRFDHKVKKGKKKGGRPGFKKGRKPGGKSGGKPGNKPAQASAKGGKSGGKPTGKPGGKPGAKPGKKKFFKGNKPSQAPKGNK